MYRFGTAILATLLALAGLPAARAEMVQGLYRAETIVTGTGRPERLRGFRITLTEVLVRRSGDPSLFTAPAIEPYLDHAADLVRDVEYEDRMKHLPIHDEQGTRDRPHFLRVAYDPEKVDAILEKLGVKPWHPDRPLVAVWLGIKDARSEYVLPADGDDGYSQRAALLQAAHQRGVPVALPAMDQADREIVDYDAVVGNQAGRLDQASARYHADAVLSGSLTYDPRGWWKVDWALSPPEGAQRRWSLDQVTFDTAFRDGFDHVARILTGRE